ncbi:MAG: hypothetical protein ACT4PT_03690 [Methanobacteriota archaeon]
MRSAGGALVVAVAVALAVPTQAWEQLGGGPGRSGVAGAPPGPLDVVEAKPLLGGGERIDGIVPHAPGFVEADGVLVGIAYEASDHCEIVRITPAGDTSRVPVDGCGRGATAVAYDAASGNAYACLLAFEPDEAVLLAFGPATGEPRWQILAAALGFDTGELQTWQCTGAALDAPRRELVVAFFDTFNANWRNRIGSFSADTGDVRWTTNVLAGAFPVIPRELRGAGDRDFATLAVRLAPNGIVVTGSMLAPTPQWGAVWLDRGGNSTGAAFAALDPQPSAIRSGSDPQSIGGSDYAAVEGSLAAVTVGRRLLLVDPDTNEPFASKPLETLEALDAVWSWREAEIWTVSDVVIVPPGDAYVLVGSPRSEPPEAALVRLDLGTGLVQQRLPLPVEATVGSGSPRCLGSVDPREGGGCSRWDARITPLPGDAGFLVWDSGGESVLVAAAPAERRATVELATSYPAPGAPLAIRPAAPPGLVAERFDVQWGDGPLETLDAGSEATHRYAAAGARLLRVTALYDDGTTGTAEEIVQVGGTPPAAPPELTRLQKALAPENQDRTFFLLGLVLTAIGALVGLGRYFRRRGKLARNLAALERIRDRGRSDPSGALRDLSRFRAGLRSALASGTLDEGQYSAIRAEADRLLRFLLERRVAPYSERLTPAFRRLLSIVLDDGRLDPAESRELLDALEREERLAPEERNALARLLTAG